VSEDAIHKRAFLLLQQYIQASSLKRSKIIRRINVWYDYVVLLNFAQKWMLKDLYEDLIAHFLVTAKKHHFVRKCRGIYTASHTPITHTYDLLSLCGDYACYTFKKIFTRNNMLKAYTLSVQDYQPLIDPDTTDYTSAFYTQPIVCTHKHKDYILFSSSAHIHPDSVDTLSTVYIYDPYHSHTDTLIQCKNERIIKMWYVPKSESIVISTDKHMYLYDMNTSCCTHMHTHYRTMADKDKVYVSSGGLYFLIIYSGDTDSVLCRDTVFMGDVACQTCYCQDTSFDPVDIAQRYHRHGYIIDYGRHFDMYTSDGACECRVEKNLISVSNTSRYLVCKDHKHLYIYDTVYCSCIASMPYHNVIYNVWFSADDAYCIMHAREMHHNTYDSLRVYTIKTGKTRIVSKNVSSDCTVLQSGHLIFNDSRCKKLFLYTLSNGHVKTLAQNTIPIDHVYEPTSRYVYVGSINCSHESQSTRSQHSHTCSPHVKVMFFDVHTSTYVTFHIYEKVLHAQRISERVYAAHLFSSKGSSCWIYDIPSGNRYKISYAYYTCLLSARIMPLSYGYLIVPLNEDYVTPYGKGEAPHHMVVNIYATDTRELFNRINACKNCM
jgi:hypothetical protein